MNRKTVSGIIVALSLIGMLTLAFSIQPATAYWTIYIRADGSVDPPTALILRDGDSYTLLADIPQSIEIERNNMTLNGMNYTVQGGILVGRKGMGRSNVTVKNIRVGGSGIGICSSTEISLVETVVSDGDGLRLWDSHDNTLVRNRIENSGGVRIERSDNNTLEENLAVGNEMYGFWIRNSRNNTILRNAAMNNAKYGLLLDQTHSNTLRNNNMSGNQLNFGIHGYDLADYIHDIDTSNFVDDKAIYYFLNSEDIVINNSTISNPGYLAFVNSTNINVQNLTLRNNYQGVLLAFTTNSTIKGCKFENNQNGIELRFSDENSITENALINNSNDGIHVWDWLSSGGFVAGWKYGGNTITKNVVVGNRYGGIVIWYADFNNITRNTATSNGWAGIALRFTNGNPVLENKISTNGYGIHNYWSAGNYIVGNTISNSLSYALHFEKWSIQNTIFHNNFVNNADQVYVYENFGDVWDGGLPSGGNYWSDYSSRYPEAQELDGSGIWDTPYVIDVNNQDNYPLMEPWTLKPSTPIEASEELVETIQSWNLTEGTENSLTSKLDDVIHLLEKGNNNGAMHKLMDFINQVEGLRGKKLTDDQADYLVTEAQRIIDLIEE